MTFLVPATMFGWIPLGLSLFAFLPVRKAIIAGYLIGWLFLPQAGYPIPGLPDYTRMTAVNLVILLGAALVDNGRLLSFRPRVWDLPMVIWCLSPLPTSISNGLGAYDGMSGFVEMLLTWGAPYVLGRVYFNDRESLRMLAIGVLIGGLIYMPLCWWEMRMSPHLHRTFYGFNPTKFHMANRLGGYRPMMFLSHGVEVGLWMCATAVVGLILWRSQALRRIGQLPMNLLSPLMLLTALLCRSMNALGLSVLALSALFSLRLTRTRLGVVAFLLIPATYICVRAPLVWDPQPLIDLSAKIDPDRAESFSARVEQEDLLTGKAWRRPVFGWGSYGRNRVLDDDGEWATVTDSLWIITFGQRGLVGLVSLYAAFALPGLLLVRHTKRDDWFNPRAGPAAALAVVIGMYAGDCLMNAMLNPIYHLMMGSVLGFALREAETPARVPAMQYSAHRAGRAARVVAPDALVVETRAER